MAAEGRTQSIQARIAALNVSQVGRAPITARVPNGVSPPQKPPRPQLDQRSQSTSLTPALSSLSASNEIGNGPNGPRRDGVLPPPTNIVRTGQADQKVPRPAPAPPPRLPARKQPTQPSPALPPRRPSEQLSKKGSNESISSTISTLSALSSGTTRTTGSRVSMDPGRVKAPVFDPALLPPLPAKRTKEEVEKRYQDIERSKAFPGSNDVDHKRMFLKGTKSASSVATVEVTPPPTTPSLPPRRPSRPDHPTRKVTPEKPPSMPARSALSFRMNKPEDRTTTNGVSSRDPSPAPHIPGAPPPVPLGSRPDLSKIQVSKPKALPSTVLPASICLLCRDFSAQDSHASRFPRESIPSIEWLAKQLVAPFDSPTDQARTIFTWLHHNIAYDTVAFFNNNLQPSTPASTLSTGLAVCEGYAGLFTAIASKAGLESVVVGGHGKGFGFSTLQPGEPIPAEYSTHAWNAVKIDNGAWKLIDACWGAGNVSGKGQPYNKDFTPRMFTTGNDEFGLRHFPTNKGQFFRSDGGRMSWDDYIVGDTGGELARVYSGLAATEGMSETSFLPRYLKLPIAPSAHQGPTVHFQFSHICEHWDPVRNGPGKPYVFILGCHGVDGKEDDYVPFENNGLSWWVDVVPQKLGARGQTVSVYTIEKLGGESGRGLSLEDYRLAKGRKGWSGGAVAAWELV